MNVSTSCAFTGLIVMAIIHSLSTFSCLSDSDPHASILSTFDAPGLYATKTPERYAKSISVDDNGKPTLVVHVGPLKTGTSSFQYALQNMDTTLQKDGYTYFGRTIRLCEPDEYAPGLEKETCYRFEQGVFPRLGTCIDRNILEHARKDRRDEIEASALRDCFAPDKALLEQTLATSTSNTTTTTIPPSTKVVILSEEKLSSRQYYISEGLGDEWNVVAVVGYRRLWQWLASSYFQSYRLFTNTGNLRWDNKCDQKNPTPTIVSYIMDALTREQDRGGPLDGWTERVANRYKKQHAPLFLLTDANRIKANDLHVSILNFHAKDGQLVDFLCNMLPDATSACEEARSLVAAESSSSSLLDNKSNPRNIDYDAIGCAVAGKLDLADDGDGYYSRLDLMQAVRDFLEEPHDVLTNHPDLLPMQCLDNRTLEYLWDESIRLERELVPRFYHETDQNQHRKDFEDAIASGKFCSVDMESVFSKEEKMWKSFFKSLKKEAKSHRHRRG